MLAYTVLDVFTDTPLEGNPLAVFHDAAGLSGELMQGIARELNLSETVFLLPDDRVRIFTPATELAFAGHPVLGAAFAIGAEHVRLETGAGAVPVTVREGYGEMEQPTAVPEPFEAVEALLAALGVARSELPVAAYRNGPLHVYVALADEDAVGALRPDMRALADLGEFGVSCFSYVDRRVKTRMFAPSLGVDEDPATGSAAGPLALHLVRHASLDRGQEIEIRQGEELGRPSLLRARVEKGDRVFVGGSAVVVARGEFLVSRHR